MDLRNDGPVSVNYSSHDEVVLEALFYAPSCLCAFLIVSVQVTLEIETNPPKTQEKSADGPSQTNKTSEPRAASQPMQSVD